MSSVLERLQTLAQKRGTDIALHDGQQAVTYKALHDAITRLRQQFIGAGVSAVALAGDNSIAWIVCDLALLGMPVRVVPEPMFFSASQIAHVFEQADVDIVVATGAALPQVPGVNPVQLQQLDTSLDIVAWRRPVTRHYGGEYEKVTFTSGSTGKPKGVRLSLPTLEHTANAIADALQPVGIASHMSVLPYATLLENVAGMYAPLLQGLTIHIRRMSQLGVQSPEQFNPLLLANELHKVKPHATILVPQLLLALVTLVQRGLLSDLNFRFIAVGGGKVSPNLLQVAEDLGLPVYEGYGLSECGSVVALNVPGQRRVGTVGKVLPHARVEIDADGEIRVGGAVMKGYLGEAELSSASIASGDIGYLDDQGFLHVSGRRKNLFITAYGRNVNPEWVESELLGKLPIAQVAVFGEALPHNIAIVVPRAGFSPDAIQAAVADCNRHLPDYARIGRIIVAQQPFTAANGMATANGRTRRDAIATQYSTQLSPQLSPEVTDGILPAATTAD